jgi:quercetin dioxygenase-like cupin family protein
MPFRHVSERAARARSIAEPWGSMSWLVDAAIAPGAAMSVARMELAPGATSPAHHHPNCDEAITVLAGCVTALVDDREVAMRPGDVCWVPRASRHAVRNDGAVAAVLMLAYSEGRREYRAG